MRAELARLPALPRPEPPAALAAGLEAEVATTLHELRALKEELTARLTRVAASVSPPPRGASRGTIESWQAKQKARTREEAARFEQANSDRLLAIKRKLDALRPQLEELWPTQTREPPPEDSAMLLEAFARTRRRVQGDFEYHVAVLEPGLSPEQRRLLFGAAIELLDLPLPGPEPKPQSLPKTTFVK